MSEDKNVSAEPGSAIAAAKRASKVAPPPPPTAQPSPIDPPTQSETTPKTPTKTTRANRAKAATSKSKPAPEEPKLLGRPAGRLRQVLVHLRNDTRALLDQSVETNRSSLGVEAMHAVRSVHQQLRSEAPTLASDDSFAPARRVTRQMPRGEAKVPTTLTITPQEAEALQNLATAVSASVAFVVDDCIVRHHAPRLTDEV